MSDVIATAARLKPEIRLANEVSQFEASLSSDQKAVFRDQRSQSLQAPPDVNDVMQLTAQLDRSEQPGGRCFGPPFTKFLHGVQQFAALGDVIATVNHSSYLESLSLLLMEASRSIPQHYELAILYPRSKVLQSYIIDYFIVVVQICRRFHAYTRKSVLSKIVSSLNDADIKEFQSKLVSWSKSIGEEMSSLVAHTTEEEAQKNSRFRALMTKSSKATSRQQKVQVYQRILNLCSEYDYETTWRQIRKTGNSTLYTKAPEYIQWKEKSEHNALLFTGKLGSGKSVMMANMVDDLFIQCISNGATVAYFFCRHNLPESLKARTIIGALVRQMVRPFIHALVDVELVNAMGHDKLDYHDLANLLRQVLPRKHKLYVVIDGLDLCDSAERNTVANQLQALQVTSPISYCVALRLEPDARLESMSEELPTAKVVLLPDNTADIETFIQAELTRCLEVRSLLIGNPLLILDIHEALSKGSKGMFLWVALQIKSLCTMQTDEEITVALGDLPQDLSEIYDQILRKSPESGKPYQKQLLEIVTAAQRPLTPEELREAVSVSPGDTIWTAAKLVNDIYATMASCGCLLFVEEEERTVRFMHPSVEQYLFRRYKDSEGLSITIEGCHRTMADIIVTYLNYGVFGTEVSTFRVPKVNVGSAPAMVIQSTTASSKGTQSLALKLLKLRKQPDFDVGRILAEELRYNQDPMEYKFHFHEYAQQWCLRHVSETYQLQPHVTSLLPKVLERSASTARRLEILGESYVMGALQHHNVALMKLLLNTTIGQWLKHGYLPSTFGSSTAFEYAVCMGYIRIDPMCFFWIGTTIAHFTFHSSQPTSMGDVHSLTYLIICNLRGLYPQYPYSAYSIITCFASGGSESSEESESSERSGGTDECSITEGQIIAQAIAYTNEEQSKWMMVLRGDPGSTMLDAFENLHNKTQSKLKFLFTSTVVDCNGDGDWQLAWNGAAWE